MPEQVDDGRFARAPELEAPPTYSNDLPPDYVHVTEAERRFAEETMSSEEA